MIALPAGVTFATAPRVLDEAARAADAALERAAGASSGAASADGPSSHGASAGATTAGAASAGAASAAIDVDLAGCDAFDSSLLAVLLELTRRAAAAGAACRLHHPPPNLRKLAALYGVDELLFGAP